MNNQNPSLKQSPPSTRFWKGTQSSLAKPSLISNKRLTNYSLAMMMFSAHQRGPENGQGNLASLGKKIISLFVLEGDHARPDKSHHIFFLFKQLLGVKGSQKLNEEQDILMTAEPQVI